MPRRDRDYRLVLIAAAAISILFAMPAAAECEASHASDETASTRALPIQVVSAEAASTTAPAVASNVVLEDRQGYNSDYIFGMTKGVANSTVHDAVKPMLMLLTIPLDLAFLPFAAIGGLFG